MTTQGISKPANAEQWAEFWERIKALKIQLHESGKTYIDLTDIEFKNTLVDMSQGDLVIMMTKMKSELGFYKRVLTEPYYTEHPEKKNTNRYESTLKKAQSINAKGKIIRSFINQ